MTMKEGQNVPDVQKVFAAIALIVTKRGEGNVRLASVRSVRQGRKAG